MAITIQNGFIQKYNTEALHLYSQAASKLRQSVWEVSGVGAGHNITTFGSTEVVFDRVRQTVGTAAEIPVGTVNIAPRRMEIFEHIDDLDTFQSNQNFRLEFTAEMTAAFQRGFDKLIIDALALTAKPATPLTNYKLDRTGVLAMGAVLNKKDIPNKDRTLVVSYDAYHSMLSDNTLTSSDYLREMALSSGEFKDAIAGFKVIPINGLPFTEAVVEPETPALEQVFGFHKRSVVLNMVKDLSVRIDWNTERGCYTVYMNALAGAKIVQDHIANAFVEAVVDEE